MGMIFNSTLKKIGRKFIPKQANHPSLSFLYNKSCTIESNVNPLVNDEIEYQKRVRGINNFKFNEGHFRFNQSYFLAEINKVYVEPTYGIAIKGFSAIIEETVFFDWYNVSKRFYLKTRIFSPRKIVHLQAAVMFDCAVGLNYFHFYNDIISKLEVIKEGYFARDTPLIIGKRIWLSMQFQFFMQFPAFKQYNWFILESDRLLFVNKLYYIKAKQYDYTAINNIAGLAKAKKSHKLGEASATEKIFINRRPTSGRFINNFVEVELALIKHGFKVVYLEDHTIDQQMYLIKNAKIIIGIHGAGLTNLIYANRNECKFIEIMPINYMPTHYYWLASVFQVNYKTFIGNELNSLYSFSLDIPRFGEFLNSKDVGTE